jgi:hypothetical protein
VKELVMAFVGSCAVVAMIFGHFGAIRWLIFHNHDIAAIALAVGPAVVIGTIIGYKAMTESKRDR